MWNVNIHLVTASVETKQFQSCSKFTANMAGHYSSKQQEQIHEVCLNEEKLENMNVNEFVDLFLI